MTQQAPVPIIGRHAELSRLNDLLEERDSRKIVCISGSGGIGKTRLLQEFQAQVLAKIAQQEPLRCSEILDFDNPLLHTLHNIGRDIATQIDEAAFEAYLNGLVEIRKMEIGGVNPQKIADEHGMLQQTFSACFNAVAAHSRVILLFDTTDALQRQPTIWRFWADVFPRLRNCVLLIAGRDANQIGQTLQAAIAEHVDTVEISPLQFDDSAVYLHQKLQQMYTVLAPELIEKLILIAYGKPILLDLAVEWQARNIPLTWLLHSSLDELKALSDDTRAQWQMEFERHLVSHIANVHQTIDRLILTLSRIYPLDSDMLATLLKVSDDEARRLCDEAQTYVFIKTLPDGKLTLHDEMRRMVNAYVWEIVDPEGDRRRRDSHLAAQYFQRRAEALADTIQHRKSGTHIGAEASLELAELEEQQELCLKQRLTHAFAAYATGGFAIYLQAVGQARNAGRLSLAKQLEEIVQPHIPELSADQHYQYQVLHGRLLNDAGDGRNAKTLFRRLLEENQGNLEREADIYNALAISEVLLGDFNDALEYQQKCYDILNWLNKRQFISEVANHIGYIYRLKGDLQASIRYYRLALDAALQSEHPHRDTVARILNNLGYVYGLEGKYHEGKTYCEQAIHLWTTEHLDKRIGWGQITLGSILKNRGDYAGTLALLHAALPRFEEPEDSLWLVRAYLQIGWTHWYQAIGTQRETDIGEAAAAAPRTNAQHLLDAAQEAFERSLELARKYYTQTELPTILGQYGRLCWARGEKDKARQLVNEAFEFSQRVHDLYQAIDSLLALTDFDYVEGRYDTIPEYAAILRDQYEQQGDYYPLYFGRMRRILADVAYNRQDYDAALSYYAEGLALIKQHGGYRVYSIMQELVELERKLDALSPVTAYKWVEHLKAYWAQQSPKDTYATLLIWCDQQIVRIKFR